MSQKNIRRIWFGSLLFFTITVVSIFVYLYKDAYNIKETNVVQKTDYDLTPKNKTKENGWIKLLSSKISQNSYLPVAQIKIQLDKIDSYDKNKKIYNFTLYDIDEYKFFCAKQVLESYNRPFSFVKRDKILSISVVLEKQSIYKDIIKELRKYEIDTKL